jgi:hypothetical protein
MFLVLIVQLAHFREAHASAVTQVKTDGQYVYSVMRLHLRDSSASRFESSHHKSHGRVFR